MKILTTLTYYTPHISGLTIYARRLSRRLIEAGHEVSVLTAHYERALPGQEVIEGATIVRSAVLLRASKGALMPAFPLQAARLIASHDVVHIHLPQFEASAVALIAKAMRKPIVVTYHCDIELPPGIARTALTPAIRMSHYITGKLANRIVVNTEGYARSARLPRRFHAKVQTAYPPIELATPDATFAATDRSANPVIGFVGRFAEEKGIETLLNAAPHILRQFPNARFELVGQTLQVPGEHVQERVQSQIAALGDRYTHLGMLSDAQLSAFYRHISVLVLPSINSTESFGMTQAEAMLAGTPVVASDLPGVREAVEVTGMGLLVPPRDPSALAEALVTVLRDPEAFRRPSVPVSCVFSPEATARAYEEIFQGLVRR